MSNNFNDKEVLLKVEHLSQYFKLGQSTLKAVNDVSFDIKKAKFSGLSASRVAAKPRREEVLSNFITAPTVTFILKEDVSVRAR